MVVLRGGVAFMVIEKVHTINAIIKNEDWVDCILSVEL